MEFELGRFNVLIGEQATGKSSVAKLLSICRYFSYILAENGNNIISNNSFENGLQAWGLLDYTQNNSFIAYECEHYFFQTNRTLATKEDLKILNEKETENTSPSWKIENFYYYKSTLQPKSKEFKKLLDEYNKIKEQEKNSNISGRLWQPPTSFYLNDVNAVMDNPFYSPTERGLQSIFSLGRDFSSNITNSLFRFFAKSDEFIRFFKNETEISPLKIFYRYNAGTPEIKKETDNNFIRLHNAASGYQSALPVILAVRYYHEIRKKPKTFIVEEPELNLFPATQAELVKFFASQLQYHNSFFLTTHSPYILTSLNNLLYAFQVGRYHKEEVKKIIEEKNWVNPDEVSAYQLFPDGTCESIVDETNLIMAEKIDNISIQMNKEYDSIQDIKLGLETINK